MGAVANRKVLRYIYISTSYTKDSNIHIGKIFIL